MFKINTGDAKVEITEDEINITGNSTEAIVNAALQMWNTLRYEADREKAMASLGNPFLQGLTEFAPDENPEPTLNDSPDTTESTDGVLPGEF